MKTYSVGPTCGQIVSLDSNQLSANPSITSNLYTPAPTSVAPSAAPITRGLKMTTVVDEDGCVMTVAFPGLSPGEPRGMFGGMKWKDFITTHGEHAVGI